MGDEKILKLQVDAEKATLISLMGLEQEVKASEGFLKLEAASSVKYLVLPADSLKDALKKDYPKEEPEIKPYDPSIASPIVLRPQFPRECRDKKSETYLLPGDSNTSVDMQIYNFGRTQFSCKLKVQTPEGYQVTLDNEEASIDPMGMVVRKLKISTAAGADSD